MTSPPRMQGFRGVLSMCVLAGTALAQDAPPAERQGRPPQAAQADANLGEIANKIKKEGEDNSQVMQTLSYMTNVIGPRLTASPAARRANEWTRDKLSEWGLQNAHLEAWGPFGRGWTLKSFNAQVVEPQCIPLIAYPKAWSPSTNGTVVGDVVHFTAKDEKELEEYKGKLKNAIVLMGSTRELKAWFTPPGDRLSDEKLLVQANAPEPVARGFRPGGNARGPRPGGPNGGGEQGPSFAEKRNKFLIDEGVAMLLEPSFRGDGGTLFAAQASVPSSPGKRVSAWEKDAPQFLPQVVVSIEHFNRLVRMLEAGEKLRMAVEIKAEYQDDDAMGYNTVAEIPGTDLKNEVVMLGGHLDSWHSGTGATDNGAGVAACMEAVRILKALNLEPRRTIRIGLWTGEEQGLFGSRGYVREHFGHLEDPPGGASGADFFGGGGGSNRAILVKPEYENFCAYFNLDNGTGKIRGVYMEGNEAARPLFRKWLAPFREMGAATLTAGRTGGTDHMSFDAIGLPGFQFIQDPIEYDTRTHHSNQDVYERIQADDMKQASVIIANIIYNAAMTDEKFPRKTLANPTRPDSGETQPGGTVAGGQN